MIILLSPVTMKKFTAPKKEVNKRVKELTSQGKTGYFAKWDLINDEILEGSQVDF